MCICLHTWTYSVCVQMDDDGDGDVIVYTNVANTSISKQVLICTSSVQYGKPEKHRAVIIRARRHYSKNTWPCTVCTRKTSAVVAY